MPWELIQDGWRMKHEYVLINNPQKTTIFQTQVIFLHKLNNAAS